MFTFSMFPQSQCLLAFSIHVLFSLGCDPRFERSWYGLASGVSIVASYIASLLPSRDLDHVILFQLTSNSPDTLISRRFIHSLCSLEQ